MARKLSPGNMVAQLWAAFANSSGVLGDDGSVSGVIKIEDEDDIAMLPGKRSTRCFALVVPLDAQGPGYGLSASGNLKLGDGTQKMIKVPASELDFGDPDDETFRGDLVAALKFLILQMPKGTARRSSGTEADVERLLNRLSVNGDDIRKENADKKPKATTGSEGKPQGRAGVGSL